MPDLEMVVNEDYNAWSFEDQENIGYTHDLRS